MLVPSNQTPSVPSHQQISQEILLEQIGQNNLYYLRLARHHTKYHISYVSQWIINYWVTNGQTAFLILDTRYTEKLASPIDAFTAAKASMFKIAGLIQLGISKPVRLVANGFSGITSIVGYVFDNPDSPEGAYHKLQSQLPSLIENVSLEKFLEVVNQPDQNSYT